MATFQKRGDTWRAIVRRKGHKPKSATFPTKGLAKVWADRIELELAEADARGTVGAGMTIAELVDWYRRDVGRLKRVSKTQAGNLTRIREGLGTVVAAKLTVAQIVEHVRRRRNGEHVNGRGVRVPACGPATMTVEIGYLAELFKLAASMGKVTLERDVVAEARPALRLVKLVAKAAKRDRRPTAAELQQLREHFQASAWRSQIPMVDIIDFAIASSRRQSEITRLLWTDVDDQKRTCIVRDAKHPRAKAGNQLPPAQRTVTARFAPACNWPTARARWPKPSYWNSYASCMHWLQISAPMSNYHNASQRCRPRVSWMPSAPKWMC